VSSRLQVKWQLQPVAPAVATAARLEWRLALLRPFRRVYLRARWGEL